MATASTTKKTATTLPKEVFAVDVPNHELLKLAYEAYQANGRANLAKTLRRGEIRGGGRKPWRQKGTGRARFGSSRNPIWRTGGVVFGPLGNENYTKKISTNSKRVALRQALTLAEQASKVIVADTVKTAGKTKEVAAYLDKHAPKSRRILLVVAEKTPELLRASKNIQNVEIIRANYLNVYQILNADRIVFDKASLENTTQWLGAKS